MSMFKAVADYFLGREDDLPPAGLTRNDPCWCGSGRKYKKCCLSADEEKLRRRAKLNCGKT